jgi:hypothetical protein
MGINSSSSSIDKNSDCYIRNKMMRQQCLQTRPDKSYCNDTGNLSPKTQIRCDCQGNLVEYDENGRIIRTIK